MKKILFFIGATLMMLFADAQQITFQGKLYQGGQPVTGTGAFHFIIINNSLSWAETHNTVSVNNGLYAVVLGSITPMPLTLFQSSASVEMAVRYNGNWIDTVTFYAPFERDYTVPDTIKDGISWNEVSNKPVLDVSSTNELQTLSISSDSLYISQGNGVKLPASSNSGGSGNTVIGSFTVLDTTSAVMPGVGQITSFTTTSSSSSVWQSFLSTSSGRLRGIKLYVGVLGNTSLSVKVYAGVGITGQQLGNIFTVSNITGGASIRNLDLSNMSPPVALNTGQIYTFEILPPNGNSLLIGYNNTIADVYPNGVSNFGVVNDLYFEIYVDHTNPPSLNVGNNGYVGIGNNSPTSQLSVNGRVEDVTGFITPVGSVQAYAGNVIPKGWLLCDGSSVSRTQYADLFSSIGTSWGTASSSSFNLPDLRGMFLRGVDTSATTGTSGKDPDRHLRTPSNIGGNNGNTVGSIQNDAFQRHVHYTPVGSQLGNGQINGGNGSAPVTLSSYYSTSGPENDGTNGIPRTGSETRPQNAYVYYIIKY